MSEWKEMTLAEADVILIDCVHKTPKHQEDGFPYIGIPQLKEGHIDFEANPRLISELDFIEWTKKAYPKHYDVILSRRTNPGVTAHVPEGKRFALGQNLVIMRSIGNKVFKPYLRWLLRGSEWWDQINKFLNVGAVFDSLRCGDIPNFKLKIPPYHEQKAIAHILGTLDDKIELNRQMNQTLEAMAQALFKSWFVDFDPVMDNALAAGPDSHRDKIPNELQVMAEKRQMVPDSKKLISTNPELAAKFPSSFEYNEILGKWIPEGWEVKSFGEEFNITMGQSPPGTSYNENGVGKPFFQGKTDFGFRFPTNRIYCTDPKREAKKNDTLISVRAPVGNANLANSDCVIGRGLSAVRHKSNSISYTYYSVLALREVFDVFEGEGTVFGSINQSSLKSIHVIKPSKKTMKSFDQFVSKWDNKIELNSDQIESLTELRDRLLTELISRRVRVKNGHTETIE